MIQPSRILWFAVLVAALLVSPIRTAAQSGTVTDDGFISTNSTTQKLNLNGQGIALVVAGSSATVGGVSVGTTKTYIKFQLPTSLPPGTVAANVAKATLKLFISPSCNPTGAIDVYPITSDWTESTLNPSSPPTLGATALATAIPVGKTNSFMVIDVTQLVKQWLQDLANGDPDNDGIALVADTSTTIVIFDSKESFVTSHEPRLEIVLANSGPQGPVGPQGPQGAQGSQGPQGQQGPQGVAATIKVEPTITAPAGTPASVMNGGTPNAADLTFLIPQGLPGATGPQGPMGINNKGPWSSTVSYIPNDAVFDSASYWLATAANTGSEPSPTNTNWQLLAGGIVNRGTWSASSSYSVNDAVGDGGSYWLALVPTSASSATPNTSCEPSQAACAANWQLLAAQGTQGPQGQTGPQGQQGIQGPMGLMGLQGPPGPVPQNVAVTNANNNFAAPQTVGGSVSITGAGNGLVFPDGTVQTTAATNGGTSGGTISCSTFEISSSSPVTPPGYTALSQTTAGNLWFTMAPLLTPRTDFAVAADAKGNIYAIGGYTNTVEAYNPATNTWSTVASMSTARGGLAAATDAQGNIYAIGGGTNTVEMYNPTTNTWTAVASMSTVRSFSAAASDAQGHIYAMGGTSGAAGNSVEMYNPATNTWSAVASMLTARDGLAAATDAQGKIYAIGGLNNNNGSTFNTVEVYDPATNTWSTAAPMPTARWDLAAIADAKGNIYAIGGADSNFKLVSTVEVYDPTTNSWTSASSPNPPAPMPTARDRLGAARDTQGNIYAIGGSSVVAAIGGPPSNKVEKYSPPVTIYTFIKN